MVATQPSSKKAIEMVMERSFPLPKSRVWQIMSDTDRINRAIGLDPVFKPDTSLLPIGRTLTSTALRLLPMEWQEYPFEWIHEQWYEVYRHYSKGPMRTFRSGIRLKETVTDGEPSTLVQLYSYVDPAHPLLLAPVRLVAKQSMDKTYRFIESAMAADAKAKEFQAKLAAHAVAKGAPHTSERSYKVNESKLNEGLRQLLALGYDKELTELADSLIRYGDEPETAEIRPYALADKWQASRNDVLKLLLHSTRLGLFNMEWRLICPNCRVSSDSSDKLAGIDSSFHCEYCGIDYEVIFDRYVELCFSVHPDIRRVARSIYCIGAPAFSPHIHTQRIIPSGETVAIELPQQVIDWRMRVLRTNERMKISLETATVNKETGELEAALEAESGAEAEALLKADGWVGTAIDGQAGGRMHVTNLRDHDVVIVIEREGWDDIIATASQVTLFPEFRTMYDSDVLAPGQQAGISSLTVLFTDLCGSTAYYEDVGDASAYGYVRQMFDFMTHRVQEHGGAVVKTIGDAVMAVFDSAEAGFQAALAIQRGWHAVEGLDLRIGLHHGPAVTVGMNGRNDYFGRTVNMAARIQAIGGPSEIVLEADLLRRLDSERLSSPTGTVYSEPFTVELKGVHEPVELVRVLLDLEAAVPSS